jgi:HAD superfamily hydrolase (TIGR01509 family)
MLKGAKRLLLNLHKKKIILALASSSSSLNLNLFIKKNDLLGKFDIIFSTASMNLPGKPHPAVYKAVIKKSGCKPAEAVVFEDSTVGLKSAKGSGAKTIAVPDKRWSHGDFSSADLIANSLTDKRIYKFLGLK